MDKKQLIGGTLALILLGLYAYLVGFAVMAVLGMFGLKPTDFSPAMASGLSTISGLVAALVIAELAVTPPTQKPGSHLFAAAVPAGQDSPGPGPTAQRVATVYLVIWLVAGLAAYIVGDWLYGGAKPPLPALTDLGKSWFGIAIAAGYAYLGVQPQGGK